MKALFRLGVAVLTAIITGIIAFFQGGEGVSLLSEVFGDAGIAGIVAAFVAWGLGWAMSKLPKNDPA
jgi:hypothetical protein